MILHRSALFHYGEVFGMIYGYIRVSTREQNEDRQIIALREVGVTKTAIYMDKQSGKALSDRSTKS